MEDVACLLSCCHAWLCDDCIRYISESEFERCIWEGVLRDGVHVGWLVGWLVTNLEFTNDRHDRTCIYGPRLISLWDRYVCIVSDILDSYGSSNI